MKRSVWGRATKEEKALRRIENESPASTYMRACAFVDGLRAKHAAEGSLLGEEWALLDMPRDQAIAKVLNPNEFFRNFPKPWPW